MTTQSRLTSGWIRISPEMLSGDGLQPTPAGDDVNAPGFLELLTPHLPVEKRLEIVRGDIWVALFEQPDGMTTRCDFFPGDEFVYVISGSVTLGDHGSGEALAFGAGEHFLVPKGWQGTWSSDPSYREVAVCSTDWLSPYQETMRGGIIDPQRRDTVLPIDIEGAQQDLRARSGDSSRADGLLGLRSTHIHGSDVVIQLVASEGESQFTTAERSGDMFVQVIDGRVTVSAQDGTGRDFGPKDCFVVTQGFRGAWEFSPEYLGLVVTGGGAS